MEPPNPMMTTCARGYVRILAPPCDSCPKCGTMNTDRIGHVWRVADERGAHGECDVCAHHWTR
jgi:hypothetical protein